MGNTSSALLRRVRDLQDVIDILSNTTVGTLQEDIKDIENILENVINEIQIIDNSKTSLKEVKRHFRLIESLK